MNAAAARGVNGKRTARRGIRSALHPAWSCCKTCGDAAAQSVRMFLIHRTTAASSLP